MIDPYFALLERPALRLFGVEGAAIPHRTPCFDRATYQAAAGTGFADDEAAYRHWLATGRREGHSWAPGRDTLLKIVLKAKDETDLIDLWITHHAGIVGYDNLIVMDCGSTDPSYIAKLAAWSEKVLVLKYWSFFNNLHNVALNGSFYEMVCANAKYVAVLDADEFLFGRSGLDFSPRFVPDVLRARDLDMFGGIWIDAAHIGGRSDSLPVSWRINTTAQLVSAGAVAGKAIVSGRRLFATEVIGHNLHHPAIFPFVRTESFGEIVLVHLTTLPRHLMRARTLRKLVIHARIKTDDADTTLAQVRHTAANHGMAHIRNYAQLYLSLLGDDDGPVQKGATIDLLSDRPQHLPGLSLLLTGQDYDGMIQRCWNVATANAARDAAAAAAKAS